MYRFAHAAGHDTTGHSYLHHLAHLLHRDWQRLYYWLSLLGQDSDSCPRCAAYHHCAPRSERRQHRISH